MSNFFNRWQRMQDPMEFMRRIESISEYGHLFQFMLDGVTPDDPELTRTRHYYVVSKDQSYARAYCYLVLSLCELKEGRNLSRWLALYSHIFGTITSERFLELLLSIARGCFGQYAFFVDEYVARLAFCALTTCDSLKLCERADGESHKHLLQTPRDAETAEPKEFFFDVDRQRHFEADRPKGTASPSMSFAERIQLEKQLQESQLLLQVKTSQHEREVSALRDSMVKMEQKLIWHERAHQQRIHHHFYEHQDEMQRLENEMKQRETELRRAMDTILRDQESLLQQLSEENASLKQRHHEAKIETERWRMECQELKHRLNSTVMTAVCPLNSVSREQYRDLDRRHQLLHKEFDELSLERSEMEQQLQQARQEAHQRRVELDSALEVLNSLRKGLDYVGRELPLMCETPVTYTA
ncbi:putative Microtubule-associated protein Bicaudal-D [Trypanosoma cruzi]|nr:putative Microtubule-associated protein Bicaudal-D [Trypanosoma cruzi]